MKKALLTLLIVCAGCSSTNYNYEVHLKYDDGEGTMHLYNGADYADAMSYIKEYEKSHGDMVLIKTEK